jgi:hypothetical protein
MSGIELVPLAATLGVAGVILLAHRAFSAPGAARISVWAISAQIVLTGAAWAYPGIVPRETNWSGGTCPDLSNADGYLMLGLVISTVLVGGLVIGTALIAASGGLAKARAAVFTPVSLVLPYAAAFSLLLAALCGMN